MPSALPELVYDDWRATCDTLHAHTQTLGKLAVALAPPEPQLQHAALRLTARAGRRCRCPPPMVGRLVAALDLHDHEAVAEHSDGRASDRITLRPAGGGGHARGCSRRSARSAARRDQHDAPGGALDRPARRGLRARALRHRIRWPPTSRRRLAPRSYSRPSARRIGALDAGQRVVGIVRPGREPVLGRWGRTPLGRLHHAQLDGRPGDRRRLVAGDARYGRAAFYAYAHPAPEGFAAVELSPMPPAGIRSWAGSCSTGTTSAAGPTPHAAALDFARSAARHACAICGWDPPLSASVDGTAARELTRSARSARARRVQQLEEVVRGRLDLLVPPLRGAVHGRDQRGSMKRRKSPQTKACRALVAPQRPR